MMLKLSSTTKRYVVIGVSVYILELIIILFAGLLGANATLAVGISFWSGLLISFGLQKFITFDDHRMHHKILIPQVTAYTLLVLFNFCFTILMTMWLAPIIPAAIIRTLALGITTIWNFSLYKTRIFKKLDTQAQDAERA